MLSFIDTILQGILLGGLYALFALSQSLLFGVMRLTNTAHGDLSSVGAFGASWLSLAIGLPAAAAPWAALLLLLPLSFGAGYALQRFVLNGTLGRDPLPSLVVTFGLAIVIQNALQEIFTADPRSIDSGGLNTASLSLFGGLSVGVLPLLIFAAAVVLTCSLQLLFDRTDRCGED